MNDEENVKVVEMIGISKKFGEVIALRSVDFCVYKNEIVALVGDNGAGKSTLVKILSGVFPPDSGKIFFMGKEVTFRSPRDAMKLGIRTVHQKMEEILALNQTVTSNMFMGEEKTKKWLGFNFLDKKFMMRETQRVLSEMKINIPLPQQLVGGLSGGQRQALAIARAIRQNVRVLILDEPTSALGVRESRQVLKLIKDLRDSRGISIVIISHDLEEVFNVADRIVVFRKGQKVGEKFVSSVSKDEIVAMIVGADIISENGGMDVG